MRSIARTTALLVGTAVLAINMAGIAIAADLPDYPPVIEPPTVVDLPAAGGWYLRGDIGYKIYNDPNGSVSDGYGGHTGANAFMKNESMGDAYNVGIGAGYKFNDYLRGDVTLDYESAAKVTGDLCTGPCSSTETAKIEAWSGLVNGYLDLGTFYGITPYVGAGIGASYLVTSDAKTKGGNDYASGSETTANLAWALMAGASYAVTDQVSIDAGYRYINLGDAKTTQIDPTGAQAGHVNYKGIDAHEIRLGVRYNLY